MRRKWTSQKGASAVEFALLLPVLAVILFGIIEFGAILYNKAVITNASREAARYAATYYTNPANGVSARPACGDIQNYVANYVNAQLLDFTASSPFGPSNVQCPTTTPYNNYSGFTGYVDTIRIEYQYNFLVFGALLNLLAPSSPWSSITLRSETVMRDENQTS